MKPQNYISTDLLSCDLLKKVYQVKISIAPAYNNAPESCKKLSQIREQIIVPDLCVLTVESVAHKKD